MTYLSIVINFQRIKSRNFKFLIIIIFLVPNLTIKFKQLIYSFLDDFEKPSIYQSKLFHFRTFALCFQKISKLSKYKNVITFMMEEFKNLKVELNDGRIIDVNVHSFIGMF